jgi:hypothetical protein
MKTKNIGLVCGILAGLMGCGSTTPQPDTCNVAPATLNWESCPGQTKDGHECVKCIVVEPDGSVQGEPISIPDGGSCVAQFGGPSSNDFRSCVDQCQQCDPL